MRTLVTGLAGLLLAPLLAVQLLASSSLGGLAEGGWEAAAGTEGCLALSASQPDVMLDDEARRRANRGWVETCRAELAAAPGEARLQVALAQALGAAGERAEGVALYRAAAAQGSADAALQLFEAYKSFGRGSLAPHLTRVEAEAYLRQAAGLGHPDAMLALAVRLDRGEIVKRDPAGARHWMGRAAMSPPRDWRRADVEVLLGRLLAASDAAEERGRGLALLEGLARAGRGDAKAYLAEAIRRDDPARARSLLEEAARSYPGHALAALSDMLIRGEGGPADVKRALSLLQGRSAADAQSPKAALGRLYIEGRIVPLDLAKGVHLLRPWAQWDQGTRLELAALFSAHPGLKVEHPGGLLEQLAEAAELDEPGAAAGLVALKLSAHPQFRDREGGCALARRAAGRGNAAAAAHLGACASE